MDLQKKCGNRSAIEMIHTEKVTYGFLIGVFPLIKAVNSAGSCVFAAVGAGKAAMMRQLLGPEESDPPLPARSLQTMSPLPAVYK